MFSNVYVYILFFAILIFSGGCVDKTSNGRSIVTPLEWCINGVVYYVSNGIAPAYNRDGSIQLCEMGVK